MLESRNAWDCVLCAFGTVLDLTYEQMQALVGHDGSGIVRKDLPEPLCRLGYPVDHLVEALIASDYACTELTPEIILDGEIVLREPDWKWFQEKHMMGHKGVLFGEGKSIPHCVAWDGELVWDPNGYCYAFNENRNGAFTAWSFMRIDKIVLWK